MLLLLFSMIHSTHLFSASSSFPSHPLIHMPATYVHRKLQGLPLLILILLIVFLLVLLIVLLIVILIAIPFIVLLIILPIVLQFVFSLSVSFSPSYSSHLYCISLSIHCTFLRDAPASPPPLLIPSPSLIMVILQLLNITLSSFASL